MQMRRSAIIRSDRALCIKLIGLKNITETDEAYIVIIIVAVAHITVWLYGAIPFFYNRQHDNVSFSFCGSHQGVDGSGGRPAAAGWFISISVMRRDMNVAVKLYFSSFFFAVRLLLKQDATDDDDWQVDRPLLSVSILGSCRQQSAIITDGCCKMPSYELQKKIWRRGLFLAFSVLVWKSLGEDYWRALVHHRVKAILNAKSKWSLISLG